MRRRYSIAILLAGSMAAGIIDRIAVSVGNRVITETDLDCEMRITAFLNSAPLPASGFTGAEKRQTAERMVDQALVRNEIEAARYPPPTAAETDAALAEEKARFGNDAAYRHALAQYGITEDELKARLAWQLMLVRFIGVRFRPGIQISNGEIVKYFDEHMRAGLLAAHPAKTPSVDDYRSSIEKTLIGQAADRQVEEWLKEARRRAHILYHDEVFQ